MRPRFLLLLGCLGALAMSDSTLGLDITPPSGTEGTEVQVQGFESVPSQDAAILLTSPFGEGAIVDIHDPRATSLTGRIGPVAADFIADVELWWGRRFELPATLVQGGELAYLADSPSWFTGSRKEMSSDVFTVESPGSATFSGTHSAQRTIAVDLPTWSILEGEHTVRVDIKIRGGADPTSGPSDDDPPNGPESTTLFLHLGSLKAQLIAAGRPLQGTTITSTQLAADLARLVNETFGPVGVVARSDDSLLRVKFSDPAVQEGFVNVRLCGPGCGTD